MAPYIEIMIQEQTELTQRLKKLDAFIENTTYYPRMSQYEKELMVLQRNSMRNYNTHLGSRIAFAKDNRSNGVPTP